MAGKRRQPFEGHVYQRKDGLWEWKITLANGERKSFYGKTERVARDKRNSFIRDHEAGLSRNDERLTVNQYLDRWLIETATDRVRPSTLATYTSHIEVHIKPAMARIRLRELSPEHVNRMLASIVREGSSPTTANRVRATLRTALTSAVKARIVGINAAALSEARRETTKRVSPLTVPQAQVLIKHLTGKPMGPLVITAIYTGLRQGELLALSWQDIDFEEETLSVRRTLTWIKNPVPGANQRNLPVFGEPKTETSKRTIKMPKPVMKALKSQLVTIEKHKAAAGERWRPIPDEDLVFPTIFGTPQNASNVTNRLREVLIDLNLPHQRFHDLRHLTASLLLAEGMDIFTVKEILGHSQISLTANTYGHLSKKLSDAAADALSTSIFADEEDGDDG